MKNSSRNQLNLMKEGSYSWGSSEGMTRHSNASERVGLWDSFDIVVKVEGKESGHRPSQAVAHGDDAVHLVLFHKTRDITQYVANQPVRGPGKPFVNIAFPPRTVLTNAIHQSVIHTLQQTNKTNKKKKG